MPGSTAGREAPPDEALDRLTAAMREWFHGTDAAPYTAPGHMPDADDCWHCHEAAQVALDASSPARETT